MPWIGIFPYKHNYFYFFKNVKFVFWIETGSCRIYSITLEQLANYHHPPFFPHALCFLQDTQWVFRLIGLQFTLSRNSLTLLPNEYKCKITPHTHCSVLFIFFLLYCFTYFTILLYILLCNTFSSRWIMEKAVELSSLHQNRTEFPAQETETITFSKQTLFPSLFC